MDTKTIKWSSDRADQTVIAGLKNIELELLQLCLADIELAEFEKPDVINVNKIRYINRIVQGVAPGIPSNISVGGTAVLMCSWGDFPVPQEIIDYVQDAWDNDRIRESSLPNSEELFEKGKTIVEAFLEKGLPYYSAIAICGATYVECRWNVHVANKLEKDNGGVGGTGGWSGCGEGLFGLTFWNQKQKIIEALNPPNIPKDKKTYEYDNSTHLRDLDEGWWIDMLMKYIEICTPKHKDILCTDEPPENDEERTKVLCSSYLFKAAGGRESSFDNAKLTAEIYMKTHVAQAKNPKYQPTDGFALQVLIGILLDQYLHNGEIVSDITSVEDMVFSNAMKTGTSMYNTDSRNVSSTYYNEPSNINDIASSDGAGNDEDIQLKVVRGTRFNHDNKLAAYGKLYVNGKYFCDTAERNLVPEGTYTVAWRKDQGCTHIGRKDWIANANAGSLYYKFASYSNGYVPLIKGIKGRIGIRIHEGTGVSWSEGCLIVGKMNRNNSGFSSTWNEWKSLYDYCHTCKSCKITYV